MKKKFYFVLVFSLILQCILAQEKEGEMIGQVTFVTSKNVYVKFNRTDIVQLGDTLDLAIWDEAVPCLIVTSKSSTSCVCEALNSCKVNKEDKVIHRKSNRIEKEVVEALDSQQLDSLKSVNEKANSQQRVRGSVSAASYSNLSSVRDDNHRLMYRFSMNVDHIDNSKFSVETYMNYRQLLLSPESSIQKTNYFNVYNLALRYDADSATSLTIGRKINTKASSLGAIDGVQGEKLFGKIYTGVIAGFRPDHFDYGFNSNLLQFGAYTGLKTETKALNSMTTIGLLQQMNTGNVDRRYLYFQHMSTINKNLNFFSSWKLDLFNPIAGDSLNNTRLTNFYISSRYRFSRKVDLNVSYDSRKRVVFYETYKTDLERLLDDDESRQGVRMRMNVKPFKSTNVGLSYSKRFQSSGLNESDNMNAYVSWNRIPTIGGRLSVNYNRNTSNYLESNVFSFSHSRPLYKNKLNGDFYVRLVKYTYLNKESGVAMNSFGQNYYGGTLSYQFNRKLMFSILGELAVRTEETNKRINARIIKRF